ncbi:hypothetical protein [Streptomyces sp. MBT53]|uniref:DUF7426 family protein n=1 Tax=Streptomyces sp. MBT53 TaxID=1488384 RepID=UPI0019127FC6|nr:hypothetical protein [Streptomyces sp. MBT53]MBK6015624.1 hypothetical protein [Streptomyces sp. MBT53]
MAFQELGNLLDDSLVLPIKGKTYRIPAPSAATGLRVQAIMQAAATAADGGQADKEVLADAAERDMYADVLGTAHAEMVADGVEWPMLKHAAVTAMVWIIQSKDRAEAYWNTGGDPSQLAPNRQQRRSTSGAANKTRSRGSTSGTRPRPANRRGGKGSSGAHHR